MKNKNRSEYSLVTIMLMIAAMIFSGITIYFNLWIGISELILIILFSLYLAIFTDNFYFLSKTKTRHKKMLLSEKDKEGLKGFPLPSVLINDNGTIIKHNTSFFEEVNAGKLTKSANIIQYIKKDQLRSIISNGGEQVEINGRTYKIYASKTTEKEEMLLSFIDISDHISLSDRYEKTRPIISYIVMDNREELSLLNKDSEIARLTSSIDKVLEEWAVEVKGVLRRLKSGRFILIAEEQYFKSSIEKRFPVLDAVRKIIVEDNVNATISVGVGRGGNSYAENDQFASAAFDMALGRGGDQVAVKTNQEYEFFGGTSKGIERKTRLRTRTVANEISNYISKSDTVFIMGHRFSDLDSVGSAIGMWSIAKKGQGKNAYVVVNQQETLAKQLVEIFQNDGIYDMFISPEEAMAMMTDKSLMIIVDTHLQHILESPALLEKSKRNIIIDHHRKKVEFIADALIFYHEPTASSTAEIVTELVQYLGEKTLTRLEANALMSGIMLDTKNFVLKTGVRTFEAAAFLRRKGADTVDVKHLFANSLEEYQTKYHLVSEAVIYKNCAIACSTIENSTIRVISAQAADDLLGIQGVDASFVLYDSNGVVNISARSLGKINVQLIMEALGGGGHQTMAGGQMRGETIQTANKKLVEIIDKFIMNNTKIENTI